MGNSNVEVVSRQVINNDINSVNSIDPLVANKESNENAGVNPIVLNLETSIGNTMQIDKGSTDVRLEKVILDYDQCEKRLETDVLAGGPGEFVKPANLNEAERDVCLGLDNTDKGPQGMVLTTRAAEDVSLMGLGPYASNVQENADLIVESAPIAESGVDTEREEGDETEIDNHKVSKKWRWVDDVNKELSRKVNKKGKKHKKKFERKVYSSRSFATSGSIANQSLSDDDFRQRKKVLTRENEDEVNSVNAVDIWNFGKKLGLYADGDDQLVLRKLKDRIRMVKRKAM
ncbi:hypothetical protein REPUB_Repub09cG0130200 [Reevesia pubescens]